MKKFIVAVLALVMVLSVTAVASADWNDFSIPNMPCQAISDSELYKYHGSGTSCVEKLGTDHIVQIRHTVAQINADETNRIAAYDWTDKKTMGANWHPSNGQYYPCQSNAIEKYHEYTAAGRGNTNYASKYGLNNISISGRIDSYDD